MFPGLIGGDDGSGVSSSTGRGCKGLKVDGIGTDWAFIDDPLNLDDKSAEGVDVEGVDGTQCD